MVYESVDDVRQAFDNVVIADVMADHARYITDPSLLSLIRVVLQGGDGEKRTRGIDQGSAYSPTALNVRLHHAHDLGVNQDHHPLWYRYADNVVYICQSVSEGHQVLEGARQLLEQTGFTLKGADGPLVDMREKEQIQLLGFTLTYANGSLGFDLGEQAWSKLHQNLTQVHETDDPARSASQMVKSWIASYGPAFESLRIETAHRILVTAAQHGFRELGNRETVAGWCQDAWRNWYVVRSRIAG